MSSMIRHIGWFERIVRGVTYALAEWLERRSDGRRKGSRSAGWHVEGACRRCKRFEAKQLRERARRQT